MSSLKEEESKESSHSTFKQEFPNFKRGITPIEKVHSMMDTSLQNSLNRKHEQLNLKKQVFRQKDFEMIGIREQ